MARRSNGQKSTLPTSLSDTRMRRGYAALALVSLAPLETIPVCAQSWSGATAQPVAGTYPDAFANTVMPQRFHRGLAANPGSNSTRCRPRHNLADRTADVETLGVNL